MGMKVGRRIRKNSLKNWKCLMFGSEGENKVKLLKFSTQIIVYEYICCLIPLTLKCKAKTSIT